MITKQALQLRRECDLLVTTGKADIETMKALLGEPKVTKLISINSAELSFALKRLYEQHRDSSLLGSVGNVLHRILTHDGIESLQFWIESNLTASEHDLIQAVTRRQCSICCVSLANKERKIFCNTCFLDLRIQDANPWFRLRHLLDLKKSGPEELLERIQKQSQLGEIPLRILARHVRPLASKSSFVNFDVDIGNIARLESLLKNQEKLQKFMKIAFNCTPVEELSDEEVKNWVMSLPNVLAVLETPALGQSIGLCSKVAEIPTFDLIDLGRELWPNADVLANRLRHVLSEPLSLTLNNKRSKDLLSGWGTPRLFEFRRMLNLEILSEIESSVDVQNEFREEMSARGLTLTDLKMRISAYGVGFSTHLSHNPTLSPELFLAWMASTDYAKLKFALLMSPPEEVVQLSREIHQRQTRKTTSTRGAPMSAGLKFYDPPGADKPPARYVQRSWRRRFWS